MGDDFLKKKMLCRLKLAESFTGDHHRRWGQARDDQLGAAAAEEEQASVCELGREPWC